VSSAQPNPQALGTSASAHLWICLQHLTEKAISSQFDRYSKEITLRLEKRSNFEEKVLLDRYLTLRDLQHRIGRVMTDLNRARLGSKIQGLFRDGDIVSADRGV
jgi:hypothetical protein